MIENKKKCLKRPENYYLRLSVTDRCNLGCAYCDCSSASPSMGRLSRNTFIDVIAFLKETLPITKVRFTGGEPLVIPELVELIGITEESFPDAELSLTTNGVLLEEKADSLRKAGLNRINVSIDAVESDIYKQITNGGNVNRVLGGISTAIEAGFDPVKLNCVMIKSMNASRLVDLIRFAASSGCQIRFIELMPMGQKEEFFKEEYFTASEALSEITKELKLIRELGQKGTAREYLLAVDGQEIIAGFISSVSHPFCKECNRIRLDSSGTLFSCLRKNSGINIPGLLDSNSREEAREILINFLEKKTIPERWDKRPMISIGG